MRREGSAFQGVWTVAAKEISDQLSSARIVILQLLIALIGGTSLYGALDRLKETTAEDPFLLLKIFTVDRAPLPSFVGILGFLIPLLAIGLGFDAINGEHNRRTLSRILAQPIYRDALLMGKFIAGLATIGSVLLCLWLLVIGFGLLYLGVPPGTEEIMRAAVFLLVALAYCGVWLALAMLLSIIFRSAATAALIALGIWLFLTLIWPMLAQLLAQIIAPPDFRYQMLGLPTPATVEWQTMLARLSPNNLFGECVLAILSPTTRALGPIYVEQLQGAVMGSGLPLSQSLLIAWPQMVGLIAGAIVLFVAGYIVFQRQEVRA
ncbi:MAG TPA: ABC transporter permease subunit [Xanthobacteraceae bacterium]|nr:ABC transporter permease subunit [Xanthobacteraceae bacterium]